MRDRDQEPPTTLTAAVREATWWEATPVHHPPDPPTAEQLAAEMADRVRWAEWNSKKTRRAVLANQARQRRVMAQRLDAVFSEGNGE